MNFQPQSYYTRQTLAQECGLSTKWIDHHIRTGTARLDKAAEKIPGIGVRINGQLARKFIELMKAKKLSTHVAV